VTFGAHPFGGHPRGEGPFQKGVFKYIILQHLKEKPGHGYEIIRALEDRLHGLYVPSAGTIYPRLQMLEAGEYVTSVEREGKKIYSITDMGLQFLAENEEIGQAINDRLNAWARPENTEARRRTMREFHRVSDALRWEIRRMDTSKLERVREVLARTHQEILDILGE
jgi:DNA-binding PadR family transcriptional regulator